MTEPDAAPPRSPDLRLATLNLQHGRGSDGGPADQTRLERALARLDLDVLALQEVDRHQPRSGGVDQLALAARATGMRWARFAATLSGDVRSVRTRTPVVRRAEAPRARDEPGRATRPVPPPAEPGYGVALLSRHPVLAWFVAPLPDSRRGMGGLGRCVRRPLAPDAEPRVCLAAVIRTPGGLVCVGSTHLTRTPRVAARQLDVALRGLAVLAERAALTGARPGPAVLLGDLNLRPAQVRAVCDRVPGPVQTLATAETHPAWDPRRQIDHLLGIGEVRVVEVGEARRLDVSDHCLLAAGVAFGPP